MTDKTREKVLISIISGVSVGICMTILTSFINRNKDIEVTVNDKLKTDIKIEVKEEIKPELDKKLDKTLFESHVEAQKTEYNNLTQSIREIRQDQRTIINLLKK